MRIQNTQVSVQVPATSANLGPGFDTLGLALDLCDELSVEATTGAVEIEVEGEGSGDLPDGEDHLVVRALRRGLDYAGAPQTGLRLRAHNRIPHGRGLGSSAAATVAGLLLARGMISDPEALDDDAVLQLATEFEGHPDNAAPALKGGVVLSWMEGEQAHAVPLAVPRTCCAPWCCCPPRRCPPIRRGAAARAGAARRRVHNASRAALLVHALAGAPELLLEATEDRLHQEQRAPGMPESVELMRVLRRRATPR